MLQIREETNIMKNNFQNLANDYEAFKLEAINIFKQMLNQNS